MDFFFKILTLRKEICEKKLHIRVKLGVKLQSLLVSNRKLHVKFLMPEIPITYKLQLMKMVRFVSTVLKNFSIRLINLSIYEPRIKPSNNQYMCLILPRHCIAQKTCVLLR